MSIPNTRVQPKTQRSTKKKKQRLKSHKEDDRSDEDLTGKERDLPMYQLSEGESDDSLTICYKAYNRHKLEMNESSAESAERTQRVNKDIARMKEERQKKKAKNVKEKKRKRGVAFNPKLEGKKDHDTESDNEDTKMTNCPIRHVGHTAPSIRQPPPIG
jgi:hypothetical protein